MHMHQQQRLLHQLSSWVGRMTPLPKRCSIIYKANTTLAADALLGGTFLISTRCTRISQQANS